MKFLAILTILMALGLSGTALAENATIDSVTFQGDVFEFSLDKPHLVTNCNVDVLQSEHVTGKEDGWCIDTFDGGIIIEPWMDPIHLRYIGGVDSKNEHYGLYANNHNGYYAAPSYTRSYIIYSTTNLTDVIDFLKDLEVRPLPDPSAS